MNVFEFLGNALLGVATAFSPVAAVEAAETTIVVTPANTQGWVEADVRPGGEVGFVSDEAAPYGQGALQLTTDETNTAKAQYMHEADVALTEVGQVSYFNKTNAGPASAAASYQLAVDLNGEAEGGFTTLVFEPYWNDDATPLVQGEWQEWDAYAGEWWSSRSFAEGDCEVVAGAGGPPLYSLSELQASCPEAVVQGFGVNVGTYNPSYDVNVDGINFDGTVYDFELVNAPTSKEDCKKGGYLNLTDADGSAFKNQGQCVSYMARQQ